MTTVAVTETTRAAKPGFGTIAKAGGIGIAVATVLNVVLYFVSAAAGWLPAENVQGQTITLIPVLIFTIVPGIIGVLLYFALTRFLSYQNAVRAFLAVASLVLIVMATTPIFGIINPTVGTVMALEISHLFAGLPLMYFLTKAWREV